MKNEKLIIINGMERGGTNILWKLLASHPQIVLARLETGQVFRWFRKRNVLRILQVWNILQIPFIRTIWGKYTDKRFDELKRTTILDDDHKFKTPETVYKEEELEKTILCIKSLNNQIVLSEYLTMTFPAVYNIGIIRDGYALCNGYIRRGMSAEGCRENVPKIWPNDHKPKPNI